MRLNPSLPMALPVAACLAVACGGTEGGGDGLPPDATADVDALDGAETCPDGLVLWPKGGCAPRVDECKNPWELPLIGGGCLPIGPRACPKTWDPEADVDCEAGTLMEYDGSPCPEGFVLTEDEVACIPFFAQDGVCGEAEIPVLGGGCKQVGPAALEPGWIEPYFDDCPAGLLAQGGGGCMQVGPRACPKLWDDATERGCEVGDVLPCPDGWSESEDGTYCDPGYVECGPGERSLVGGGCERVVPLAEDCPAGPFPPVPDGAKDVVYVSAASSCTDGCGSAAAPFSSISAALAGVPDGGYVLVGAGEYAEGLGISKPVHVLGLCSAKVAVTGSTPVTSVQGSEVDAAGVAVSDSAGVELSGVKVASADAGIAVVGSTGVALHDVEVTGSAGVGVYAGPGSDVAIDRLWLHDTSVGPKLWLLFGVFAEGGAKLGLERSLVASAIGAGIFSRDATTEVTVADSTIRDTRCTGGGVAGYGARVGKKASLKVERTCLDANSDTGVLAEGGTLEMRLSVVSRTRSNDNGELGWGLGIMQAATATVTDCMFDGNAGLGIGVGGTGTKLAVVTTAVRNTLQMKGGDYGWGVVALKSGSATLSGCLLQGNTGEGVVVDGPGTEVALSATVVSGTLPDGKGVDGWGMLAQGGALVAVSNSLFESNAEAGVGATDAGTDVTLAGTVVRGTVPNGSGEMGVGMLAGGGAAIAASRCLFEHNSAVGIRIGHPGTTVDLAATVVRDTAPDAAGEFGHGIEVGEASVATVSGCLLSGQTAGTIVATDAGTQVDVAATVVRETAPDAQGEFGEGLTVQEGAAVSVVGCLFEGNAIAAIRVLGQGATLSMSGSVVRDTAPDAVGELGLGIQLSDGASAAIAGSLFSGNTEIAVRAHGAGTQADLSASEVRETRPSKECGVGYGIQDAEGASASVKGCLFDGNTGVGVYVNHPGTEVDLVATVVRGMLPIAGAGLGFGMRVGEGSTTSVSGCLFDGCTELGIVVGDPGSSMELSAAVVRDTNGDGQMGVGVVVQAGASMSLLDSLLARNATAGLALFSGGVAQVEGSAVLDTLKGGAGSLGDSQVFGDGIVADAGSAVNVLSTVVARNSRNGIYFNQSSGSVVDSVIAGNEFYGLAMEQSANKVTWEDQGNFVLGNATGLPPELATQVTTSTGGMPVPPPPSMAEVQHEP